MDCAVVKEHNVTINTAKQTKLISFKGRVDVGIHSERLISARNMGMESITHAVSPSKSVKMLTERTLSVNTRDTSLTTVQIPFNFSCIV